MLIRFKRRRAYDVLVDPAWNPATGPLPEPGLQHVDFGEDGVTVHTWTIHVPGALWAVFCVRIDGEVVANVGILRI